MENIIIRSLTIKDVEKVLDILDKFPEAFSVKYVFSKKRGGIKWLLKYVLSADDIYDVGSFVLEIGGKVIGHIAYLKDVGCFEGGVYELKALAVCKDKQQQSYGERLIRHAENALMKIGGRIIKLQTGDAALIKYYENLGYKVIGEIKNYWKEGANCFIMSREL